MHATHQMQPIVTNVPCVCLSVCHATQLSFTAQKTAKQIKMLFGVNTLWAHGTLYYTGILIPHRQGEGSPFKFWDPLHISGMAEDLRLEILHAYRGQWALTKTMQKYVIRVGVA